MICKLVNIAKGFFGKCRKYKVKATYNNKEDIHMALGGKGGSGGTGGGEAGQDGKGVSSGYIILIVLFIILIVAGVGYSGIGL